MTTERPARRTWAALAGVTVALLAMAFAGLFDPIGWRMGVSLATGLALASVMLAMIGSLLRREWIDLIEDELLPAAATIPLCLLLAMPLLIDGESATVATTARRRIWFSDMFLVSRLLLGLALAIAAAAAMIRWREDRKTVAAIGLPVVAIVFAVLLVDWDLVRHPQWWTPILPFLAIVNHLTGALALAFIYHLAQREKGGDAEFASLAAALLSLALLSIWVGVVQYLIGWYGNLPDAALWYLARFQAAPGVLPLAAGVMAAAALLLLWSRERGAMLTASVLILLAYLAHMAWWHFAVSVPALIAGLTVLSLWAGWLAALAAYYDAAIPEAPGGKSSRIQG